ncbi:hypothetical protein BT96DRAFT_995562 [Gymnopus androsaceus JB14]|uniref:Uncharacterized protein n=1 Tax=Gymnopus androsaceus JB14 TaxID=1447944 RepID=A0A6A4HL17_9AGAR|nr:hypothetical protein BT96DRAFT_995562 [Gymnopus androsaceus JB14]
MSPSVQEGTSSSSSSASSSNFIMRLQGWVAWSVGVGIGVEGSDQIKPSCASLCSVQDGIANAEADTDVEKGNRNKWQVRDFGYGFGDKSARRIAPYWRHRIWGAREQLNLNPNPETVSDSLTSLIDFEVQVQQAAHLIRSMHMQVQMRMRMGGIDAVIIRVIIHMRGMGNQYADRGETDTEVEIRVDGEGGREEVLEVESMARIGMGMKMRILSYRREDDPEAEDGVASPTLSLDESPIPAPAPAYAHYSSTLLLPWLNLDVHRKHRERWPRVVCVEWS